MTVLFGMDASVRYFVWTGFLLIQLLVNEGMISMGAPLNLYLVWNAVVSVAGVFLLAERIGHSIKMNRKPSESPGAYVRRLAGVWEISAELEADGVPRSDGTAEGSELASLLRLADRLERVFYAGQSIRLTDEEYRKYQSVLRKTGEIAKNTAKMNEKTDAKRGLLC